MNKAEEEALSSLQEAETAEEIINALSALNGTHRTAGSEAIVDAASEMLLEELND